MGLAQGGGLRRSHLFQVREVWLCRLLEAAASGPTRPPGLASPRELPPRPGSLLFQSQTRLPGLTWRPGPGCGLRTPRKGALHTRKAFPRPQA